MMSWQSLLHDDPVPWLLGVLLLVVGLPFFAVSTTAPLLQKWFAGTGHGSAKDPYFILPLIMGATQFLQVKLAPQADPHVVRARGPRSEVLVVQRARADAFAQTGSLRLPAAGSVTAGTVYSRIRVSSVGHE